MEKNLKIKWSEFNKEIADDNYYYLRSCIRQNIFPGAERAFIKILQNNLGKNIYDDANQTTCAGIGYHSDVVTFSTLQTIAARHFSLMMDLGIKSAVVSCITSFGIYSEILETWKEFPEELEKTRMYLKKATGRDFIVPDNVVHSCDVIYKFRNEIARQAKYNLTNTKTGKSLKIVDHIGCHYAKMFPERGVGGAEYPKVLTGMITAWGGETVDYPERRHCCGFGFRQYLVKNNRSYPLANTRKKLESMKSYQPDAIITNCPGCNMFMDRWQYAIAQIEGKTYGKEGKGIPVLSYEEFAALVLGFDPWELGLQFHQVDVEPLLDKMGIKYNPEDKYKGKNGEYINEPSFSGCLNTIDA
ncbi:MAG: heterodisulfide reductase subunit B [Bacteroidales bacterium]|nr:heterodisulfide reductase subunit B [Bacteroidales bacterium]